MTDLHTHILPCMDDGSTSTDMSLEMLARERAQGVDTVVLTSHFYRHRETAHRFLERRGAAFDALQQAIADSGMQAPDLLLGAEVAWVPNLTECTILDQLCIQGTQNMLVELPFRPWNDQLIRQLYDLMEKYGITPIFAHLERYFDQPKEYLKEIISMGTPIQVSCAPLERFMNRRPIMKMLRHHTAHLLATDCHNLTSRPPNMEMGLSVVERVLGPQEKKRLIECSDALVRPDSH